MSKLSDNFDKARTASRERVSQARGLIGDTSATAREKMSDSKARAADLLGQGRDKASEQAAKTRDAARGAANKSIETVNRNPLSFVLGSLAIGIALATLLPRSRAETKYIGGAGRKINETARSAIAAAKDAGQEQLSNIGQTTSSTQDQVKDLFGKLIEVAKSAAQAASDAAKDTKK